MKNIYKILIAFIAVLIVSCNADDVENRPVITEAAAPVLLTPQSNFNLVLQNANAASLATTSFGMMLNMKEQKQLLTILLK